MAFQRKVYGLRIQKVLTDTFITSIHKHLKIAGTSNTTSVQIKKVLGYGCRDSARLIKHPDNTESLIPLKEHKKSCPRQEHLLEVHFEKNSSPAEQINKLQKNWLQVKNGEITVDTFFEILASLLDRMQLLKILSINPTFLSNKYKSYLET